MFTNSCFISYRHLNDEYEFPEFIKQFHKVLNAQLAASVRGSIYLDARRMEGGNFVDESLAKALCESCCMIMIFCPVYFDKESLYCTREFLSMVKLEAFRKHKDSSTESLIIPIIYKDRDFYLSKPAIKNRQVYDFSSFGLWGGASILQSPEMNMQIRKIAEYIARKYRSFENGTPVCQHKGKHKMVSEKAARKWLNDNWDDNCAETFPFDDDDN